MSRRYILDEHRAPVLCPDLLTWATWYETEARMVAADELGPDLAVSTVFLAIDPYAAAGALPRRLFETRVFGGALDDEAARCDTWAEAESQHAAMVARVKAAAAAKHRAPLEQPPIREGGPRNPRGLTVGHVCTTEGACLCSSSGDECCCVYPRLLSGAAAEGSHCQVCGAPIIAIDFETGQPIAVRTVLLFSNVARPDLAARLHAAECPMVNTSKGHRGAVNRIDDPTDDDIADLNERGWPVKRCKCLPKAAAS